jgi:phosphonate ABC transporter permease subunit PhnE
MALMATLLAIIFAVPLSFLAARNLTRGLTMRLGVPISFVWGSVAGIAGSLLVTTAVVRVQTQHGAVSLLIPLIFFVTLVLVVVLRLMRLHSACSSVTRLEVKGYVLAGSLCATSLCGTLAAKLDAHALMGLGVAVGAIGFIIFVGEALQVLTRSLPKRIKTGVLAVAGALPGAVGAILVTTLAALVLTLFGVGGLQERGLYVVFKLPVGALGYAIAGVIGAALGASYAARRTLDHSVQIGLLVYTIVRGVMSVIRSIEPIVWAIIFVVWVRVGAFPGVLALFVCSIADLTKLYSEQLESIDPGPAEAITATGGNRAQVVLYGIVPQIINPYLSFTLYRWDINVRMATIIGIVGGGGIGNPLYLATRQWEWEAAGLYMLLIVVAVWAIDYFSSRLRERLS